MNDKTEGPKRNRRKKKRSQGQQAEKVRTPRHLEADWSDATKTLITYEMADGRLVNTSFLRKLMKDLKLVLVVKDPSKFLNGTEVLATEKGFFTPTGEMLPTIIFSLTVSIGNGYCFTMRSTKDGKVFIN